MFKGACLQFASNEEKVYLPVDGKKKWPYERTDKANNKIITEAMLNSYNQCKLNEKGDKTGKALGRRVIGLFLVYFSSG